MTNRARELIKTYTGKAKELAQIVNVLQEEDNVSVSVGFKNGFKVLRNAVAHNLSCVIDAFEGSRFSGQPKVTIKEADSGVVSVDVIQIAVCLLAMYQISKDKYYRLFAAQWVSYFYGEKCVQCYAIACSCKGKLNPIARMLYLQKDSWEQYGMPMTIALEDEWIKTIRFESPKLFWRIAVPQLPVLVCNYIRYLVQHKLSTEELNEDFEEFIVTIYKEQNT